MQPDQIKIGVLGGGQLGRMMIQSAISMNLPIYCLDPDPEAPCKDIATGFSNGSLLDYDTVYAFGKDKNILTIEIENVNVAALKALAAEGVSVYPQAEVIELIQDKGLQKSFFEKEGIPSAPFFLVENKSEIAQHQAQFPFFQKLRKGGYDGRGVQKLSDVQKLDHAFDAPSVLEQLVPFEKEIAVIVARNALGEVQCFPAVECAFNPEAHLVEFLFSPAQITDGVAQKAQKIAEDIAQKLGIVGILAVEMFVLKNGEVLVNELAPRPHNSGHHSIEGNLVSQFEQHLRAICGFPLGDCSIVRPAVMINLLGEKGYQGPAHYLHLEDALGSPGVYIHLYGKALTKPFRKMGHITITHADIECAKDKARQLQKTIKVVSLPLSKNEL